MFTLQLNYLLCIYYVSNMDIFCTGLSLMNIMRIFKRITALYTERNKLYVARFVRRYRHKWRVYNARITWSLKTISLDVFPFAFPHFYPCFSFRSKEAGKDWCRFSISLLIVRISTVSIHLTCLVGIAEIWTSLPALAVTLL